MWTTNKNNCINNNRSANSNPVSRAVSAKKVAKRIAKLEEILNGSKKAKEASKLDQSEEEKFEFKGTYVKPSNGRPSSGRPRKGSVRGRKNSSRNGSESGQDDGPMDFGSVARAKMISKDIAKYERFVNLQKFLSNYIIQNKIWRGSWFIINFFSGIV